MKGIIDLHTHTTASDGSMRPAELIRHAGQKGLSAIAVTDHDTIDGLEEAIAEGRNIGLEVIPGIEISVDFSPEMHMLGYFTEESYQNISKVLVGLRHNRQERNPKIVNKLVEMGFDISMEEVKREASGNIVGRPHIAKVLLKKGYVGTLREAFDKYLSSGKPAYFRKDKLTPEEGIMEIKRVGGVAVIAHPIFLGLDYDAFDSLFASLSGAGLKGIEAYYTDYSREDTESFLELAGKHHLLVTGGSDFHGNFKPTIEIGRGYGNLQVPYNLIYDLRKALIEQQKTLSVG